MHSNPLLLLLLLLLLFVDYSSIQSIEYMSSSEEQEALQSPNPFSTARRSKKYTSKKSYKEYLQSRPPSAMSDANRGKSNSINALAQQSRDSTASSDKNNNTIGTREHLHGKEIVGGAAKFSLIMNDMHGIKQQRQQSCDDTHSLKINRMHGISLTTINADVKEKEALTSNDDDGDDDDDDAENQSAIRVTVGDESATRKYCDEGLEVKQKIVTRDDWYMSDIEENDTTLGVTTSPYSNVTGVSNSVLECVNQILLQQSMDEYMETQSEVKVPKDATQNPAPTRSNKRVHFSTKNSMVQIQPRHHSSSSDLHHMDDLMNTTYENQSTYSNEYELIGSSRTYVDMDAKSLDGFKPKLPPKPDNLMKLQQIAKQRQFVHEQMFNNAAAVSATKKSSKNSDYELNESEPDYASISEVQDNIKSVKVVTAEIHNVLDDNEYSEIKEVPTPTPSESSGAGDNSFADVPKLPNVYSIIPGIETSPTSTPKKESSVSSNKCIGHDNYITKSPMKKKQQLPLAFTNLKKESASILAEINNANKKKCATLSKCVNPVPPVPIKHQQTIKIIDEKMQQEFDWYNLDAEYTKTDIVITPQIENIEEMYQFDDESAVNGDDNIVKVEYNLEDFDYEAPSDSSGIEIETNGNNFTTVIKINESSSASTTSSSSMSSSSEQPSPVNKTVTANLMELSETPKIDFKKSKIRYEKFLSESGLLSKPIMSRKKFYAGSFV
jgi:hypothetical protein